MIIILKGRVPSKKNSKFIAKVSQKTYLLPSPDFQAWHREQSFLLAGKKQLIHTDKITMTFYFPDNRRADLDNRATSVLDLLVDNGILSDDSWQTIKELHLIAGGIDKDNPRVEILL
jgi:Holliday junction resolvase RusA-like endonuclease